MVLRYWGERDVHAVDFAALVDAERKGISTADLVGAARKRGYETHPFVADPTLAASHLSRGRPIIALLEVAPGRHHYVVVVAWTKGQVVLHDPAAGSFQVRSETELMAAWE